MKVAMMQPAFLPWQGFFELIFKSDCFIFLNDFQFSAQSYHQRNRTFINLNQVDWYTVPIIKSNLLGTNINTASINDSAPWRRKMIGRLKHNYSKTPFFNETFPVVEQCLTATVTSLADLNINLIKAIVDMFGWEREFRISSDFRTNATRSNRVIELLRWCKATRYYCARGAYGYMQTEGVFPVTDIEVQFQNFVPASYSQAGSTEGFIPYLSVLDALFNIGRMETARLITNGTQHWSGWDEMSGQVKVLLKDEGERC